MLFMTNLYILIKSKETMLPVTNEANTIKKNYNPIFIQKNLIDHEI